MDDAMTIAEAGRDRYEDFDKISVSPAAKYGTHVFDAIRAVDDPEMSADLVYYLGNNPAEGAKLDKLKGTALALQVGRLVAGIEAGTINPKSKGKAPSGAPRPIKPIGGGDSKPRNLSNVKNINDWIAQRNQDIAKRAGKK